MQQQTANNLIYQVSVGDSHLVRKLLEHGADPNQSNGLSLWNAAFRGDEYITILLLNWGADPNCASAFSFNDVGESTPLMCAAYKGHSGVVRLLIDAGADVNETVRTKSNTDVTALDFAKAAGWKRIILLLRQAGARASAQPSARSMSGSRANNHQHIDSKNINKTHECKEEKLSLLHIDTIQDFDNLLKEFTFKKDLKGFEALMLRVIKVRQDKFGQSHASALTLTLWLAEYYQKQNRLNDAEALYHKLVWCDYVQESNNHLTRSIMNGIATLYQAQGRHVDAQSLYLRVLQDIESLPDPYSSQINEATVTVGTSKILLLSEHLNKTIRFYAAWGKYDIAEDMYCRLLVLRKARASHEQNPVHLNGLLILLREQKMYDTPERLMRRLHEIYQTALGIEHPYTLHTLNNLAETYRTHSKYSEAETAYLQLLELQWSSPE